MRNEYMLQDEGHTMRPIAKCYAEIFMQGDRPVRSHLVEFDGPPPKKPFFKKNLRHVSNRTIFYRP